MIVAIERNKFNYLYKYNAVFVDNVHVRDIDITEVSKLTAGTDKLVSDFDQMLPCFEEDHEVILLEVDKSKIQQGDRCLIYFNAVLSIYPLTTLASKLLEGRFNPKFRIEKPVFEKIVEAIKLQRTLQTRLDAIKILSKYFGLPEGVQESTLTFLYEVAKNVVSQKKETNYFEHLLSYNKTPSYVPEGNVEYLCKIGIVAMRSLGQNEDSIVKGPFYKSCIKNKALINKGDLFESYQVALKLPDDSFQQSFKKITEAISGNTSDIDVFRISYFYIAFRSILLANDANLEKIDKHVRRLVEEEIEIAKWTVALLGFAFSFENLYESIHAINKAPLFREQRKYRNEQVSGSKLAEPDPKVIQKVSELPTDSQHDVVGQSGEEIAPGHRSHTGEPIVSELSVIDNSETFTLEKSVLLRKIETVLGKRDAKAWVKHLEKRFKDSDRLSWNDVKLSILESDAKHFKESNQNYVRNFFRE